MRRGRATWHMVRPPNCVTVKVKAFFFFQSLPLAWPACVTYSITAWATTPAVDWLRLFGGGASEIAAEPLLAWVQAPEPTWWKVGSRKNSIEDRPCLY